MSDTGPIEQADVNWPDNLNIAYGAPGENLGGAPDEHNHGGGPQE